MYLDSCIVIKLLVVEPDSEFFIDELEGKPLVTSELTPVEVFSALLARERAGKIEAADRKRAWKEFHARVDTREIRIEPMNATALRKAAQCLELCHPAVPLRALDALHLAACDLAQEFPLCTTDARMRAAAQRMAVPVFPDKLPLKI